MFRDLSHRSTEIETMDDLEMSGDLLIRTLDTLATINQLLGGNRVALSGIKALLSHAPKDQKQTIVDLGCGNGDILRAIASWGRQNQYTFELIGIDANKTTVDYAEKLSSGFPEITYLQQDVLSDEFKSIKYDVALCTLFLHHFEDDILIELIKTMSSRAKIGVIVNDLHRHRLAYLLFSGLSLFIKNKMITNDGLISITKGFKKKELIRYAQEINFPSQIKWRWAFRYQWIIKTS